MTPVLKTLYSPDAAESGSLTPEQTPCGETFTPPTARTLIAIPIFNEINYVQSVIKRVRCYHQDILFIDDGSTDGTAEVLDQIAKTGTAQVLRHETNQGYGRALINAFDYAHSHGYEWVITMDCDEQHDPALLPCFFDAINENDADIVSGSRYMASFDDDDLPPAERRRVNCTLTTNLNEIFREQMSEPLTDSFCGFKAHRVQPSVDLDLDEAGYAFPMQLWPRAIGAGLRIREIPVKLIYNDPNRSFGGNLDQVDQRLRHYIDVLNRELALLDRPALDMAEARKLAIADGCA
ncbi:MAG: glycosyltransferase family 2 protein [Planctomycetota bacterium]